jgi:hypothetical protein
MNITKASGYRDLRGKSYTRYQHVSLLATYSVLYRTRNKVTLVFYHANLCNDASTNEKLYSVEERVDCA